MFFRRFFKLLSSNLNVSSLNVFVFYNFNFLLIHMYIVRKIVAKMSKCTNIDRFIYTAVSLRPWRMCGSIFLIHMFCFSFTFTFYITDCVYMNTY